MNELGDPLLARLEDEEAFARLTREALGGERVERFIVGRIDVPGWELYRASAWSELRAVDDRPAPSIR